MCRPDCQPAEQVLAAHAHHEAGIGAARHIMMIRRAHAGQTARLLSTHRSLLTSMTPLSSHAMN